jgi:hypothetical protein
MIGKERLLMEKLPLISRPLHPGFPESQSFSGPVFPKLPLGLIGFMEFCLMQ